MTLIDDREAFADELRTVADRIEDGEYELSQVQIERPGPDGNNPGMFGIEFYTTEEMQRMAYAFEEARQR